MNVVNTSQTISLLELHAFIFVAFTTVYVVMDFKRHFDAAPSNVLYFSTSIHTGVGAGDIVPITGEGKAVVTLHMLLSFIATLLVLQRI